MTIDLTRRTFVQAGLSGMAALMLPVGCGRVAGDLADSGAGGAQGESAGRWFDDHQYATIRALADIIIPPDRDPGGAELGIADYIDFLLGAFTVDPPRIFAAGPFSGRHGGENNFRIYLPLSRVQEIAWRIRIEGTQGLSEREFNGAVKGWQQVYSEGVEQLDALAQEHYGVDFKDLTRQAMGEIKAKADSDFILTVWEHCVEGAYAAPEYGGNHMLGGWKSIGYEGDRQPIGYSREQVEEPDRTGMLTSAELDDAVAYMKMIEEKIGGRA